MKLEIKKLWTAALRSGEFKQGHTRLRYKNERTDYWCCLGVLCEMHRQITGLGKWINVGDRSEYRLKDDASRYCLPYDVAKWAGLPVCREGDAKFSSNPTVAGWSLGAWNDGCPSSLNYRNFNQIADLIEREL